MSKIETDYAKKIDLMSKVDETVKTVILSDNKIVQKNIALCGYNQVSYNKNSKMSNFIKQLSLPCLTHSLASLPHEIISMQTLAAKLDFIYYFKEAGNVKSLDQKWTQSSPIPLAAINDIGKDIPVNELTMNCVELSINITDNLTDKILTTITEKAGTVLNLQFKTPEELLADIKKASNSLREKIGKTANFIVLPLAWARLLKPYISSEYDFDSLPTNIRRIGYLQNNMVLFINGYEKNRILLGYRGSHPVDAGFIYSPHIYFYNPEKQKTNFIINMDGIETMINKNYFLTLSASSKDRDTEDWLYSE